MKGRLKTSFTFSDDLLFNHRRLGITQVAWALPTKSTTCQSKSDNSRMGLHFGIYLAGQSPRYSLQQRKPVPSPVRRGKVRMGVASEV